MFCRFSIVAKTEFFLTTNETYYLILMSQFCTPHERFFFKLISFLNMKIPTWIFFKRIKNVTMCTVMYSNQSIYMLISNLWIFLKNYNYNFVWIEVASIEDWVFMGYTKTLNGQRFHFKIVSLLNEHSYGQIIILQILLLFEWKYEHIFFFRPN